MQCPHCGNDVPARPICLRCGFSLFGSAAMPASALGPVPVPLTAGQKVRLPWLPGGPASAGPGLRRRARAGGSAGPVLGGAQGRGSYFGKFERLGTLRMIPKAHFQNSPGQRYRVVYSPASKIVWALEPPDPRVR